MTKKSYTVFILLLAVVIGLLIGFLFFLKKRPEPKPAPVIVVKPTPSPEPTFEDRQSKTPPQQPVVTLKAPTAARKQAAKASAAPEPAPTPTVLQVSYTLHYEGETVHGFDIPPRLYVMAEDNARFEGSEILPKPCKQFWFNWPCYVESRGPNGNLRRLRVFRCLDWDAADPNRPVKFDQVSCNNQRAYDEKR